MFLTFDLLLPPRSCSFLDAIDFNLLPIFLLVSFPRLFISLRPLNSGVRSPSVPTADKSLRALDTVFFSCGCFGRLLRDFSLRAFGVAVAPVLRSRFVIVSVFRIG